MFLLLRPPQMPLRPHSVVLASGSKTGMGPAIFDLSRIRRDGMAASLPGNHMGE